MILKEKPMQQKKSLLVTGLFMLIVATCIGQTTVDSLGSVTIADSVKPKRLNFGLGFGFNFVGGTNISLAPNLTYKVSDKLSVGAGLQFSYMGIKNLQKTITYGVNALAFYTPVNRLITTIEFAQLKVNRELLTTNVKDDFWESALFLGAGFQITPKIAAGAKYNVLYNKNKSIYSSPIVPFVNINF